MEFQGIAYDLYSLNIMINCFCRRRKLGFAFSVLGKMLKLGKMEGRKIKLDAAKYNIIIDGLCKDGKLDDAINLFNEMEMKGIKAMLSPTALSSEAL
ncbi:unnamed protein product [Microthlaspi erraticum]|uniref:Pentacotripeptide-repeat region of PRORP domain-containing protein n=1 Tax=Microthlaspi erraticum TaxID=1685480 RepID=A0A6D2J4G9_9BRAS|nr:unnamed protein product [Microthlaspi erraticum]